MSTHASQVVLTSAQVHCSLDVSLNTLEGRLGNRYWRCESMLCQVQIRSPPARRVTRVRLSSSIALSLSMSRWAPPVVSQIRSYKWPSRRDFVFPVL
jgi:hypothetical protein